MNYMPYDVVVVPFPFTDKNISKCRPALVLSNPTEFNDFTNNCVLAMITSYKNPDGTLDVEIEDLHYAGLPAPSKVRMKLFTLDVRLIVKKIDTPTPRDQRAVVGYLKKRRYLIG